MTPPEYQNINVRVPVEVLRDIDRIAEVESKQTGLRIDRSQVVRRALIKEVAKLKQAAKKARAVA